MFLGILCFERVGFDLMDLFGEDGGVMKRWEA